MKKFKLIGALALFSLMGSHSSFATDTDIKTQKKQTLIFKIKKEITLLKVLYHIVLPLLAILINLAIIARNNKDYTLPGLLKNVDKSGDSIGTTHSVLAVGLPIFKLKVLECLLRMGIFLGSHIADSKK